MLRRWLSFCLLLAVCLPPLAVRADLEVNVRTDKVVLKDGTEIDCIVLAVTPRAVLIVEPDPKDPEKTRQRVIPSAQVEKIVRGDANGSTTGFQTQIERAQKVIQGVGYRREEATSKDEAKGPQAPTSGDPVVLGKAAKLAVDAKSAKTTGQLNARDLTGAYLSRFPALKAAAQSLIGLDKLAPLMEQAQQGDALARKQVEGFLKLVLSSSYVPLNANAASGPPKAVKPGRRN